MNKYLNKIIKKIKQIRQKPLCKMTEDDRLELKILMGELKKILNENLKKLIKKYEENVKIISDEEEDDDGNYMELVSILLVFLTQNNKEFNNHLDKILDLLNSKEPKFRKTVFSMCV